MNKLINPDPCYLFVTSFLILHTDKAYMFDISTTNATSTKTDPELSTTSFLN